MKYLLRYDRKRSDKVSHDKTNNVMANVVTTVSHYASMV